MSNIHCVVQRCKTTVFNKSPGVQFHPLPTNSLMRDKWLQILKKRCEILDWNKSKICSKHFENKYFDAQRKLRETAIPTLFPVGAHKTVSENVVSSATRTKLDKLLNKLSQADLIEDIKKSLSKMNEPLNLDEFVTEDLKSKNDIPIEVKLWVLIKKQEHLTTRLTEQVIKNKKHVEVLQNNIQEIKLAKKEVEKNVENYKYIIKCLQEKQATLEEQIEILSTVESK